MLTRQHFVSGIDGKGVILKLVGVFFSERMAFPTYLVKTSEIDDLWQQIQMAVRWERGSGRIKTSTDVDLESVRTVDIFPEKLFLQVRSCKLAGLR
jgi:hypothetical protein